MNDVELSFGLMRVNDWPATRSKWARLWSTSSSAPSNGSPRANSHCWVNTTISSICGLALTATVNCCEGVVVDLHPPKNMSNTPLRMQASHREMNMSFSNSFAWNRTGLLASYLVNLDTSAMQ